MSAVGEQPAIEVTDLHVVRGGVRAVDGVSFTMPYGEVVGRRSLPVEKNM